MLRDYTWYIWLANFHPTDAASVTISGMPVPYHATLEVISPDETNLGTISDGSEASLLDSVAFKESVTTVLTPAASMVVTIPAASVGVLTFTGDTPTIRDTGMDTGIRLPLPMAVTKICKGSLVQIDDDGYAFVQTNQSA
jgi:hypothetical protein